MNDKVYDLAIVGSGPAGLFCAIKLVRNGYKNIVLIDKGLLRKGEVGESLTEGFAGAGAHSDGKVNMTHKVGGTIYEAIGMDRFQKLLEEQDQMWLDFSPTIEQRKLRLAQNPRADVESRMFEPNDEAKVLRASALANHMELETYNIRHLGTDNMLDSTNIMYQYLIDNGVDIILGAEVDEVEKEEENLFNVRYFNVGDSNIDTHRDNLIAKEVLISIGRSGGHFFRKVMTSLNIPLKNNGVDIGVRVEVPNVITSKLLKNGIYEPKMLYRSRTFDDKVRTFCYSNDTKVYTKKGFVLFKDLDISSDEFISVNPETNILEWVKATDKQVLPFNGKMINLKSKSLNLLVTPDHRMYVKSQTTDRTSGKKLSVYKNKFKNIKDLKNNDRMTCENTWNGFDSDVVFGGHSFSAINFSRFMGWYLSEGSTYKSNSGGYYATISQDERKAFMLEKVLQDCKIEFSKHDNKYYMNTSNTFKDALMKLGYSYQKYIPEEIKSFTKETIRVFLENFVLGDGSTIVKKHGYYESGYIQTTYYTSSIRLANDLCELILKSGKRPSFNITKSKDKLVKHYNGEYASNHDMYCVREPKSLNNGFDVIKKSEVYYNDFVYDVTLEKNHTLLVERNGKIWWGSNCWCDSGFVAEEEYRDTGIKLANGHSFADKKSENTNFALLVTKTFSAPFNDPHGYAENFAKLANMLSGGGILVQRYGDFRAGRRSTAKRILEGALIPTLTSAEPGDISLALPYRQLMAIDEMLQAMDKVLPGIASDYTLLYALEAKFFSNKVDIDSDSMTAVNGLYVGGDGSGWTRGLNQAAIQGLVVAEGILRKAK